MAGDIFWSEFRDWGTLAFTAITAAATAVTAGAALTPRAPILELSTQRQKDENTVFCNLLIRNRGKHSIMVEEVSIASPTHATVAPMAYADSSRGKVPGRWAAGSMSTRLQIGAKARGNTVFFVQSARFASETALLKVSILVSSPTSLRRRRYAIACRIGD